MNGKNKLKKNRLQEQALADQKEYQYIVKKQIADMEEDRRQEEIRKNIYNANGEALRRQMKEKAEKKRVLERGIFFSLFLPFISFY